MHKKLWLLMVLCLASVSLRGANFAFVFHSSSSTVSIYDADTLALLGTPTVGTGAFRAFGVPNPSNPTQFLKLYVVTTTSIVVLDPQPPFPVRATLPVSGTVPVGPNSAVLTGDGRRLLVASGTQVNVVNTTEPTDSVALAIPLDTPPTGIVVLPNSRRAYVMSSSSTVIRIIELTPFVQLLSLSVSLPAGPLPTAIGMPPNGSRIYAASPVSVFEFDRISFGATSTIVNPFIGASAMVFDPDPPSANAVLTAGSTAPIVNLVTRSISLTPFSAPGSPAINEVVLPGGNRAFLLAGSPGRVYQGFVSAGGLTSEVISPQTGLPFGTSAVDIEASPDGRALFMAFAGESRLARIDPTGLFSPAQVTTSLFPTGISLAYAPATQAGLFEIYGGNNQTAPSSTTFPATLAVRARASNPHPAFGQTVVFSSTTSGVVFSDPTAQTNLWGVAETQVILPSGTLTEVQATLTSGSFISTATFTLNGGGIPGAEGLSKVSGDRQMVAGGGTFPLPFVVRATTSGIPIPFLTLTVTASAGLVCPATVTTELNGEAPISCSTGAVGATTAVEINVSDSLGRTLLEPFFATVVPTSADLPVELTVDTDGTLIGVVRETLAGGIRVRAAKADGIGVEGVGVAFSSVQDVTFNPSTAVTGSGGVATTAVTFGCFVGTGAIRATLLAPGTPSRSINFTTTVGPPTQMLKRQGDNQSGNPGRRLDGPGQALVVQVTDVCGNGISGQRVNWSVSPSDAATLENVFANTDVEGRSSVLVRLGNRPGPFNVIASFGGLSVSFTLRVNIVATRIVLISGNNQSVSIGQTSQPLVVEVQDDNGIGAAGVDVAFRVTGGPGTLTASSATTDSQGRASTRVQAGSTLGTITVVAEAVGRSVTFTLTTIGRVPVAPLLGFANGASFRLGWVPGSLGTIFGVGLMEGISGVVLADRAPFPTILRGVRVVVDGIDAPIISLVNIGGQEQINIQVPFNIPVGTVTVVIHNNGSSASIPGVRVFAVQPGIFEFLSGGTLFAAALHADFSVVTPANPARRGEIILLFLTGLGPNSPAVGTNVAGPVPPAIPITRPIVGLNDEGQEVLGSFYAPGLFTAYQINFRVGENARSGIAKLSVVADGVASQDARLPIQ